MAKQCTCGRAASYPYCDGTHKTPKEKISSEEFDKEFDLENAISKIKQEDTELLERLKND
jgi:CDGSH-type Zn-finger protein